MGYTAMVLSETLHLVASFLPFASSSALTMMMLVSSVDVSTSNLGLLSSCTIDSLHGACERKESGSVFGAAEHKIHTSWKQYIDSYQKINGNKKGVSLFR